MNIEKTKKWIKKNKEAVIGLAILGVTVTGAVVFAVVTGKKADIQTTKDMERFSEVYCDALTHPEATLKSIQITESWKSGNDYLNAIVNYFTARDMGQVGIDLMTQFPEITEDTVLTGLLSTTSATKPV